MCAIAQNTRFTTNKSNTHTTQDRHAVVDSGAEYHTVHYRTLADQETKQVRIAKGMLTLITANGAVSYGVDVIVS